MQYLNRIKQALQGPRIGPSPQIREFLLQYGLYNIIFINVCRKPVQEYILKAAEIISLGEFNKKRVELNYDKLFHLYLLLTLRYNDDIIYIKLEKNKVVQIKKIILVNDKDCMLIEVLLNYSMNLNTFINNGIKLQGSNFWIYDSIHLNCQNFVNTLLRANSLGNEKIYNFVEQNVDELVVKPVQKIFRFVTDLAARIDIIKYGFGLI